MLRLAGEAPESRMSTLVTWMTFPATIARPSASLSDLVSKHASVAPSKTRQGPHLDPDELPPARLVTRSVAPTIRSCMICSPNGPFVSCPASTRRQKSASHPSDSSASERPTASSAARCRAAKSVAGGAGVAVARAARVANRRLTATTRRRGVFVFAPSALASINSATEPRRCRRIGRGYAYPQTRSPSGELDSDSARVKA